MKNVDSDKGAIYVRQACREKFPAEMEERKLCSDLFGDNPSRVQELEEIRSEATGRCIRYCSDIDSIWDRNIAKMRNKCEGD